MISELQSKQILKVKDEKGKYKNIPYGEISKYLDSQKKEVREYAAKQFYKVNSKYSEIVEFEINSILENKKIMIHTERYLNLKLLDYSMMICKKIL
jgi:oligoendopeptidase F